jgi:hypothetical protein
MKKIIKKNKHLFMYLAAALLIVIPRLVFAKWDASGLGDLTGLPESTVGGIIENALLWILGIFGFLGVIGFAISGIIYITAAGDDDRMKTAKQAMQYSMMGVIVGLSGVVVIMAVNAFLNGSEEI